MSQIKTKEAVSRIKVIDKGTVASERMRSAFIRTKQNASALVDNNSASADEYSSDSAQNLADNTLHDTSDLAVNGSKAAMRKGRVTFEKRIKSRSHSPEENPQSATPEAAGGEPHTEPPHTEPPHTQTHAESPNPQHEKAYEQGRKLAKKRAAASRTEQDHSATTAQRTELNRYEIPTPRQSIPQQEHTIKTAERSTRTIRQTAKSTGKATVMSTGSTIKSSQRTVKTAEQTSKVAVKTSQASAKATQKAAAASAKAARTAAQAAKATAKAVAVSAEATAKAAVTAVKAIIAAIKELVAAIAAGGWVAVLIIVVVVLIVAIIASPFGIFFSGESTNKETVPASAAIAQINYDFNAELEALQEGDYDDIVLTGSPVDWTDVLAVFAVKVAGAEDSSATYVAALDAERVQKLKNVFYDMTSVSHAIEIINHPDSNPDDDVDDNWSESILHITVSGMTAEEAAAHYGFSEKQTEMLSELLAGRELLRELTADLSGEIAEAKEILKALPEDLSPERREVVKIACSLVGKVNYFWGGKSRTIGWDSRWGTLQKVWADGSSTTGTYRPYGLDCSGFVDWVFYNASDGEYIISHGGGAAAQHSYCRTISWDKALPGDLVFYPEDEHIGIVAGRYEDGNLLIIHCASRCNNVAITSADGFANIGRPLFY